MASIALVALTILYDELGAHRGHWFVRNAVNAAGFTSFEVGAALVASKLPSPPLLFCTTPYNYSFDLT